MVAWFHRLKVSQKLTLISFIFMVPDSVLLTLFLFSINGYVHFAQWERYGNEYQRPLEQLLQYLPAHHLAAGRGDGQQADAAALSAAQARIDRAFTDLEATDARIGDNLQFTEEGLAKRHREHIRVETVRAEWRDLKTRFATLPHDERERRHLHLLSDVRTMITHAGDNSNLILDPDLDSYYLMDVTLLALPQMQERMATVMADRAIEPGHVMSSQERRQLAVYAALLKASDLDRIVSSAQTAVNEDPNFYGRSESLQHNIPPAVSEFSSAAQDFIHLTEALSQDEGSPEVTPELAAAFQASADRTYQASFALWGVFDRELDGLLANRIDYFRARRSRSLVLTALAVMAAIGFVTFITRSISGPLKKQAAALQESNRVLQEEMSERRKAEAALIEASRQAGMAEVATGVLHNVGNVLNSVNVGAAGIRERLQASRLTHLRKVADLVDRHQQDLAAFIASDPQGQALPAFLIKLTRHLEDENRQIRSDADVLVEHIDHVKQIVSMQQSYARVFGMMETLEPQALVEDAIRLNADSYARHQVTIDRRFTSTRAIVADRHKVLQILVNLLRNAKQAIGEANPDERRVTVHVADKGADRVIISVTDTGAGIAPENLTKVFQLGFTTKRDGHGFGLHSSALAARELKGALSATSEGQSRGATFSLELPAAIGLPQTRTA